MSYFAFSLNLRPYNKLIKADINEVVLVGGRGLHSSTFQLNVSAFCGIEGALGLLRGCLGGVHGY